MSVASRAVWWSVAYELRPAMIEMSKDLRSGREHVPAKKPPPPRKRAPQTLKRQLRNFAPWINRFGCSVSIFEATVQGLLDSREDLGVREENGQLIRATHPFCRYSEGGNAALASGALFVLIGALSRASAEEDTEETCEALFGRTPPNLDKLAKEMAKLSDDQASYKWKVISSVYLPSDRRLDKDFSEKLEDKYGVKLQKVPRGNDVQKVIETANEFIREESDDRLTDMISPEQRNVNRFANSMLAMVGVYVHPWWQSRFDKNWTKEEPFYETKNKAYRVKMMRRESMLPYVQAELCPGVLVEVAGIPCRGQGATVYFVMPLRWFDLGEVVARLTGDRAARVIGYCRPRRVRASIPKLHMSFNAELRKAFSSLGAESWLNRRHPAFDGIVRRGGAVALGQTYHQVVIKLNEDGDQAVEPLVDEREAAVEFLCNQPFVILFHHTATNAVWMLAEVKRPSAQGPQPPVPSTWSDDE